MGRWIEDTLELTEVKRIVEAVLTDKLGASGFSHIDVEERVNEDDEEILFIRSVFGPGWSRFSGQESIMAIHEARMALLAEGEDRFPLIVHAFPQDQAA